jgi:hypothetical protein
MKFCVPIKQIALIIVGRELIAERDPRRREHRVGQKEDERPDQEIPEIEHLALAFGELPEHGETDRHQNRADENEGSAPPPPRSGVVGNVADDRIGDGVKEARQTAQQTHQHRVHAQSKIEDHHQAAQRARQKIVGEGA